MNMPKASKRYRRNRKLSEREVFILHELMLGRSLVYIAKSLGLKYPTAKSAAKKLYDKLGADSKLQAVLFALDMKILPLGVNEWRNK